MADRLYRSRDDRMLAGVAGGVAEVLDVDPSIIRVVWAVLVFLTGGIALLVYIVMAVVVPDGPPGGQGGRADPAGLVAADGGTGAPGDGPPSEAASPRPPVAPGGWLAPDGSVVPMAAGLPAAQTGKPRDRGWGSGGLIAGLILILIGAFFLLRQFVPAIDLSLWWPVVSIGLGVLLVVISVIPSRRRG